MTTRQSHGHPPRAHSRASALRYQTEASPHASERIRAYEQRLQDLCRRARTTAVAVPSSAPFSPSNDNQDRAAHRHVPDAQAARRRRQLGRVGWGSASPGSHAPTAPCSLPPSACGGGGTDLKALIASIPSSDLYVREILSASTLLAAGADDACGGFLSSSVFGPNVAEDPQLDRAIAGSRVGGGKWLNYNRTYQSNNVPSEMTSSCIHTPTSLAHTW